ncbi:MAG: hypothetical protein IKB78_08725 [Clostridia bacterium]|nr:hypothetical protein [Clostridia bacterium]
MKKLSQAFDFQKFQQNPKLAGIVRETEGRYAKAALSDDDLELISAAGVTTVPTVHPEVLLGRHARPDNTEENKP